MNSTNVIELVISAFLYLILLSSIGSQIAEIIGGWFRFNGKTQKFISTLFCFFIVSGWDIGLFSLLFGNIEPGSYLLFGSDIKSLFFRGIDILGTSLLAGEGSGMVSDTFKVVVEKLKEWRAIASLTKEVAKGDTQSAEKVMTLRQIRQGNTTK